jgi:CheY-like chemotaxis protein
MDLRMPVLDGLSATKAIREWELQQGGLRKPATIFALTSNVSAESRRLCTEAGMDGFLGKPVDLETLRKVIESV